jgi:hypothetical protein
MTCVSTPCFDIFLQVHKSASMFISCDSLLQDSLSLFTTTLQNLHVSMRFRFVLICKLVWHPPCTNFVILDVLVGDGICRSTDDVQLIGYISDRNLSAPLNQIINFFNAVICEVIGRLKLSSSTIVFLPLQTLFTHWYTFLYVVQFSLCCESILLWISEGFTPFDHKNRMTACCPRQWCNPEAELTCLHYDCKSFGVRNGYPWHA